MHIIRCRSRQLRECLFGGRQSFYYGKNLNEQRQRDRNATGGRDPIDLSQFFGAEIEEHDNEKKQDHDGAGIDENLNDSDEVGVEHRKERSETEKRNDQAERARDR